MDRLERWMLEVVSHPDGVSAGLETDGARRHLPGASKRLEDVVEPSKALGSAERLGIYANMYFCRLVDVLAEEFPTVRHVLGGDLFTKTVTAYVTAHPSTHYSLSMLGRAFPEYLRDKAKDLPHQEFVSELALLERAIEEVFDAPRAPEFQVDDLLEVPRERWAEIRLRMILALRLYAFRYPVNDFYQARRDERHMDLPAPETSWLVVFRRNFKVWRLPLTEVRYALLDALARGRPLGAALETGAELPGVDLEELIDSVHDWFQEWAGEGLFAGVELAG